MLLKLGLQRDDIIESSLVSLMTSKIEASNSWLVEYMCLVSIARRGDLIATMKAQKCITLGVIAQY